MSSANSDNIMTRGGLFYVVPVNSGNGCGCSCQRNNQCNLDACMQLLMHYCMTGNGFGVRNCSCNSCR